MKTLCYTVLWFASVMLVSVLLLAMRHHASAAPSINRYQLRIEPDDVVIFDTATGILYVKPVGTNNPNFFIRDPVKETTRTNDPLGLLNN